MRRRRTLKWHVFCVGEEKASYESNGGGMSKGNGIAWKRRGWRDVLVSRLIVFTPHPACLLFTPLLFTGVPLTAQRTGGPDIDDCSQKGALVQAFF